MCCLRSSCLNYFNPRPPWGGRHFSCGQIGLTDIFQSTPSVGRATSNRRTKILFSKNFNPRPPWGGRRTIIRKLVIDADFNPRPPWGGRQKTLKGWTLKTTFQSTPSVGRATVPYANNTKKHDISIHALRGEGDKIYRNKAFAKIDFNPRPPWGGRLCVRCRKPFVR